MQNPTELKYMKIINTAFHIFFWGMFIYPVILYYFQSFLGYDIPLVITNLWYVFMTGTLVVSVYLLFKVEDKFMPIMAIVCTVLYLLAYIFMIS
jgi:hypothetical protein